MSKSKVNPDLIHFVSIRVLKAHFELGDNLWENHASVDQFKLGAKSEAGFNIPENYMRFRLFLKMIAESKEDKNLDITAEYILEMGFYIDNLSDFITYNDENKSEYSIQSDLGATIAGISYSTARGIILERTQSTEFNGVLLPVINPMDLIMHDTYSQAPQVEF